VLGDYMVHRDVRIARVSDLFEGQGREVIREARRLACIE